MRSVVATLAVVALCGTYVLVPERSIRMERHTDLRTSLTLAEDMPLLAQQRLWQHRHRDIYRRHHHKEQVHRRAAAARYRRTHRST